MKLPFLLNSVSRSNTVKDVELTFSKLLKVLPSLDGNTVSHCLNLLSKKEINHPRFYWRKASDLLTQRDDRLPNPMDSTAILSKYDVKDVCIILNSFAKVGYICLDLINASTKIINQHIRHVHTRDLCNVIHSLGKLKQTKKIKTLLNKAIKLENGRGNVLESVESIHKLIRTFNEKDFSMLLRVCLLNKDLLGSNEIINKMVCSLSDKYDKLSDQTIAILANSIAFHGKDENNTLSILTPIIISRLNKGCFTPQCVAQISNGYARIGIRDIVLMNSISRRICSNISEFTVRSLVNCLNGFSKLNCYDEELFKLSKAELINKVTEMTPQCISNTISAYAKFSSKIDRSLLKELFNILAKHLEVMEYFDSFIPQNYANILNGISKVRTIAPALFYKFGNQILNCIHQLNGTDLATIFNAYSRCNIIHSTLIIQLSLHIPRVIGNMLPMELSSTFNSLGILYTLEIENLHIYQKEDMLFIYPNGNCAGVKGVDENVDIYTSIFNFRKGVKETVEWLKMKLKREVIEKFRPLDIRLVTNSLLKCNVEDDELFDKLISKLQNFTTFDLAMIVNSYSSANVQFPSALNSVINRHLDEIIDGKLNVSIEDILNLLSSFIKLDQAEGSTLRILKILNDNLECDQRILSLIFNNVSLLYHTLEAFNGSEELKTCANELLSLVSSRISDGNKTILPGLFHLYHSNNHLYKEFSRANPEGFIVIKEGNYKGNHLSEIEELLEPCKKFKILETLLDDKSVMLLC